MAINTDFQKIQRILMDFSDQGQQTRKNITQTAGLIKAVAGALVVTSAVIILSSAIACVAHPILGAFGLMFGAASFFVSYDSFIIARNIQVIARGGMGNLAHVVNRVINGLNPDAFVASVLKDTLVVDSLFREYIVEKLTRQVVA